MASRYGHQTLQWLLNHGWEAAPVPKQFVCGDRLVVDPQTKQKTNVYEAAKLQKERTGEYPEFLSCTK